jgi:hypothetical protein
LTKYGAVMECREDVLEEHGRRIPPGKLYRLFEIMAGVPTSLIYNSDGTIWSVRADDWNVVAEWKAGMLQRHVPYVTRAGCKAVWQQDAFTPDGQKVPLLLRFPNGESCNRQYYLNGKAVDCTSFDIVGKWTAEHDLHADIHAMIAKGDLRYETLVLGFVDILARNKIMGSVGAKLVSVKQVMEKLARQNGQSSGVAVKATVGEDDLFKTIEELHKGLANSDTLVTTLRASLTLEQRKLDNMETERDDYKAECERVRSAHESACQALRERNDEIVRLSNQCDTAKRDFKDTERILEAVAQERDQYLAAYGTLRRELRQAEDLRERVFEEGVATMNPFRKAGLYLLGRMIRKA